MTTQIQRVGSLLSKVPPAHAAAAAARRAVGVARRPFQVRAYFAAERPFAGLQIGCGYHHLDGWLPTDLEPVDLQTVYLDATRRFPFAGESFDYVVAEHIIEHLRYDDGLRMLGESRRVLRRGGVIRVSTPDIHLTRRLLTEPLPDALQRYVTWSNENFDGGVNAQSVTHVVNRLNHEWGHTFLYDAPTLISSLERAGFTGVRECEPYKSDHPELINIDRHAVEIGEEFNQLESLIVEATAA